MKEETGNIAAGIQIRVNGDVLHSVSPQSALAAHDPPQPLNAIDAILWRTAADITIFINKKPIS